MRSVLKHIVARTYKPLLVKYLSKTRIYRYGDIRLEIPPEVFHPGFFSSTKMLLHYISVFPLQNKKILELGAGSGLISLYAAKKKAVVTATDINPVAIAYLQTNSVVNNVQANIILSDLFKKIPRQSFDMILINPPYYKKEPRTLLDHAWFCGESGEYFSYLFNQLRDYLHKSSAVLMTLCDGCDFEMISVAAAKNNFSLRCLQVRQNLLEKNFIYQIEFNH